MTAPRARSVHLPRRLPRRPESFVESPGSICEARRQPCARPGRLRRKEHLVTTDRHAGRVRRLVPACLLAGLIVVAVAAAAPVGTVSYYADPSISDPAGIAAGPDGALWFTNHGNNSIGRITTAGTVTNYTGPSISSRRDRGRARRRPVVHQQRATTRSGGSPPAGRSPTTPTPASATRTGSRPGPTARSGSPTSAATRSGGSPPPGRSPTTPTPASAARAGSRPGPTAPCGSPNDGNNSIGRITTGRYRHQLHRTPASATRRDRGRTRRRPVVHQHRATTRSGGSRHGGAVTNYTDPGISVPNGIAAGPDGALWFTNNASSSIGRITTGGADQQLHRPRHRQP